MAVQRRRHRKRKRRQGGGALIRCKPRLVDKIAHGMSMFLSGPAPGVGLALGKLGGQALKGITDNVQHYRQRGGGILSLLKGAAKLGIKLGKSKDYKRMGALGVGGAVSNFRRRPWAV